jgi:hypothetical protein
MAEVNGDLVTPVYIMGKRLGNQKKFRVDHSNQPGDDRSHPERYRLQEVLFVALIIETVETFLR